MYVRIFREDPRAEGGFAEGGVMSFDSWLDAHPEFSTDSLEVIASQLNAGQEVVGTNPETGRHFKLQREG